ncbi:MAG TPA: FAD-linked oxidase C-terminal domain-containing protein, partial [Smithellaceae bacterium]|nr:FAD-linked oxidase C-terminal domain-containing protein [Smithellaceae bacterium]
GTLGIVTKATISLVPPPAAIYTLIAPFANLNDAIGAVPKILTGKVIPMAVEFIDREAMRVTEQFLDKRWPSDFGQAHLMIILDGSSEDEALALAQKVAGICLENGSGEIIFADAVDKQRTILELRSKSLDSLRKNMLEILDITIPRARIADFVRTTEQLAVEMETWLPTYGHAADGNVHTHIMKARWKNGVWTEIPGWREKYPVLMKKIHALGKSFGGVISGEHGIGITKKPYMEDFLGKRQIALMKSIKNVFDPQSILNPGKIFSEPD